MKDFIKNFNKEKLNEAIKIKEAYKNGEIDLELANAQMKAHVGSLTPTEIAYLEQEMMEQVGEDRVKEDIDHMMKIYDGVSVEEEVKLPKGHPIQNYIDENNQMKILLDNIDELLKSKYIKNQWDEEFEKLNQFKMHLSRKQNQLYTYLEHKGFDRPTTTMWLFDNDVRDKISEVVDQEKNHFNLDTLVPLYEEMKEYLLDLIDKEDTILFPTSLELLSDEEFKEMVHGDKEIGYCLITPEDSFAKDYLPKKETKKEEISDKQEGFKKELQHLLEKYNINDWTPDTPMDVKQGKLSLNQINLLYQTLPVDLSYVDENERVAFYSDTKHRVFPRSKGVIGRDVKNCHPLNSVGVVEEIIEKFRSGEEDKVEFWINKPEVFIYIVYTAVRDAEGNFKGILEMMQDCTRIRSLTGSKTLLDWDKESTAGDKKEEKNDTQKVNMVKEDDFKDASKITVLTPSTKLMDVLKDYPGLKEYMISKSEKFAMMNSPMFKVVGKKATAKMVSERTGIPLDVLQKELTYYIENIAKK